MIGQTRRRRIPRTGARHSIPRASRQRRSRQSGRGPGQTPERSHVPSVRLDLEYLRHNRIDSPLSGAGRLAEDAVSRPPRWPIAVRRRPAGSPRAPLFPGRGAPPLSPDRVPGLGTTRRPSSTWLRAKALPQFAGVLPEEFVEAAVPSQRFLGGYRYAEPGGRCPAAPASRPQGPQAPAPVSGPSGARRPARLSGTWRRSPETTA